MENQWKRVIEIIKDQVSEANFKAWFLPTTLESVNNNIIKVSTPSTFIKTQLSQRYVPLIYQAVGQVYGKDYVIEFKVDPSRLTKPADKNSEESELFIPQNHHQTNTPYSIGLNPKYTLGNFVVGLSNNLAYAAACAVAQNPGTSYNPLFIYGGTGVGKTHLMQGIGNALVEKNLNLKIIYCSSEGFTNDFIQSIQNKKTAEFRTKYRSADLLLIDDIQFIAGRDSTQEEFFHTYNELHAKNTQIILTSDRPPNELVDLESRLKSRFQGGLMVDIQLPDFDTRVAILRAKCKERNEIVPEECLTLIAQVVQTNARELEGKLIQILQTAKLTGNSITLDYITQLLGKPSPNNLGKLDYKKVLSQINSYFDIKMPDLVGPRRKRELVVPRQLAMYILYEECKLPFERIGQVLGGRDHTTILHGVDKVKKSLNRDREIQRVLIEIKQALVS